MITYRIFSDKNARLSEEHPSSSGWGGRGHCAGGSLSSKKGLVCLQSSWNGLFLHCVLSRKHCKQVTPQLIQKQVMGFSGSRRNCLKLVWANTLSIVLSRKRALFTSVFFLKWFFQLKNQLIFPLGSSLVIQNIGSGLRTSLFVIF